MLNQEIENIIAKSLTGNLHSKEETILNDWINHSKENKKEFEAYSALWEKSKDLVLSDSINVEASLKQIKKRMHRQDRSKNVFVYLRQAAAVILLALSLNIAYNYIQKGKTPLNISEKTVTQEIKAAYGSHIKLQLADGTNVHLNSGSTLQFPLSFKNLDERKVKLHGEGYFEVAKDATKPFIVNTTHINVKVYGTSFNVSAWEEYNSTTIALVEGKVSLIKEYASGQKELMTLKPNDVVDYNWKENKLYHTSQLNMNRYTAWKEGYIVFFGDPIDKVVQRLEKWYNVEIVIKDKALENYSFTATFANESLEQVLKLLSLSSPLKYKITPAQKQKDNTYSMRKVTLSIK